jgi:phosphonate transport system substrate-binding protein
MNRILLLRLLLAVFLAPIVASNAAAQTTPPPSSKILTLGLVSTTSQREIEEHFREFVLYFSRRYHSAADAGGKVMVADSLAELAKLLEHGQVDFYLESPYPTYVVNQVHGAGRLLLRRWKSGMAEYRSLIATRKDSGITRVDQLRGRLIAFEDPESTSGYFLPKFFLQRSGFKLGPASAPNAPAPAAELSYIFAQSSDKVLELILAGQVAAGAISDDDFDRLDERRKADLTIIGQTDLLPRHLVSVRKGMTADAAERLSRILQSMHENKEGEAILLKSDNTTRFDVLPGGEEAMRRRLLETFYVPDRR